MAGDKYTCSCFVFSDGGHSGTKMVSRATWYAHQRPEKRRRLAVGGGAGGPARTPLPDDGESPSGRGGAGPTAPSAGAIPVASAGAAPPAEIIPQCDAEDTPEPSIASSPSNIGQDPDPEDVPPPEFVAAAEAENVNEAPPSPMYQPTVSTNELRLPVGQFKDNRADLALYA